MIKSLTIERDKELRKRFDQLIYSGVNSRYFDWHIIVRLLSKQEAPRFYITPKMAEQYVLNFYRGKFLNNGMIKQEMIRDLVENYERIKANNPEIRAHDMWVELVHCKAKSFYLKEKTIKYIVYEYIRSDKRKKREGAENACLLEGAGV